MPVSPKAFQLLEILIERRPNAISKEELHQLLWPITFVSDANLPNLMAELRGELGDDARTPHIIRTVQRFGYAFEAQARPAPAGAESTGPAYRLIWGNREIALEPGENVIGRMSEAVVWIDHASVSRRHARILVDAERAVLEDLGSKNGTALKGSRVSTATALSDGDEIEIGPARFTFRVFQETGTTASNSAAK